MDWLWKTEMPRNPVCGGGFPETKRETYCLLRAPSDSTHTSGCVYDAELTTWHLSSFTASSAQSFTPKLINRLRGVPLTSERVTQVCTAVLV